MDAMVVRKRLELLKWTSHLRSSAVQRRRIGGVGLNSITLHILQDSSGCAWHICEVSWLWCDEISISRNEWTVRQPQGRTYVPLSGEESRSMKQNKR